MLEIATPLREPQAEPAPENEASATIAESTVTLTSSTTLASTPNKLQPPPEDTQTTETIRRNLIQEIPETEERDLRVKEGEGTTERKRLVPWEPSDQIHVLGNDLPGRYITHMLAGCQSIPPVRYLLPSHQLWKDWVACGGKSTLHRGNQSTTNTRVVGEFIRPVNRPPKPYWPDTNEEVIHNLVVTVPAGLVLKSLEPIVHRLDHRSAICLVQDGLGIVEDIIQAYFPDQFTRPTFILGQMTTRLRHPGSQFSVAELHQRPLYLSIYTPHGRGLTTPNLIKHHPPPERVLRQTHFLGLLTAMPGLIGQGESMSNFLHRKIPTTAFRAVVDPVTTILDCTYDRIQSNKYARELIDNCIAEICDVVSRFPECRDLPAFRRLYLGTSLRREVYHMLHGQKTADSAMRSRTSRGWETDIDYLTGYFVQRGRALKVSVSALETLLLAVKSRQTLVRSQWDKGISFEDDTKSPL
ncbi:hypothetical protein OQA88_7277 [Cercophora sp. LCS_1]